MSEPVIVQPLRSPVDSLSGREREVFHHMGEGCGTRKIAELLRVSPKTVQTYHARMKMKLGVESVTQLLCEAVRWHAQRPDATP